MTFSCLQGRKTFTYTLILGGLILSILAHIDWCSLKGCGNLHGTGLFNINMSVWGIILFGTFAVLFRFDRLRLVSYLKTALLASSLGVETILVYVQWMTKEFCPLCLGVTAIILALCLREAFEMIPSSRPLKTNLRFVTTRSCLIIAGLAIGILVSQQMTQAIETDDPTFRSADASNAVPSIGHKDTYPRIRIYSDYLCPGCRRQEGIINDIIEAVRDEARIYFCDIPTHGEMSRLYIGSFLACSLENNSSENIVNARNMLFELAGQGIKDGATIRQRLEANGVSMNRDASTKECFTRLRILAAKDGVRYTPTVVVEAKDGQRIRFMGRFTKAQVVDALHNPLKTS
jgi:protein-disulfide isomerase